LAENLYEAMFVVDANRGGSEFPESIRHIVGLLTRHEVKIERIEKWDERKLAYPINNVKRGIYVLVFFRADGAIIAEMRRLIHLSEDVLRFMILRAEKMSRVKGQLYDTEGNEVQAEVLVAAAEPQEAEAPQADAAGTAAEPQGTEGPQEVAPAE